MAKSRLATLRNGKDFTDVFDDVDADDFAHDVEDLGWDQLRLPLAAHPVIRVTVSGFTVTAPRARRAGGRSYASFHNGLRAPIGRGNPGSQPTPT